MERLLRIRQQWEGEMYLTGLKGRMDGKSKEMMAGVRAKQRARLQVSDKIADEYNLLVAGAANRMEHLTGLFFKYASMTQPISCR